jgi:hypothetical protein
LTNKIAKAEKEQKIRADRQKGRSRNKTRREEADEGKKTREHKREKLFILVTPFHFCGESWRRIHRN